MWNKQFRYFLLVLLLMNTSVNSEEIPEKICETPACLMVASNLLNLMDTSADPCVDFHQAACGGLEKTQIVHYGRLREGGNKRMDNLKRAILKEFQLNPQSRLEQYIGETYKMCVNMKEKDYMLQILLYLCQAERVDELKSRLVYDMYEKNINLLLESFPTLDFGIFAFKTKAIDEKYQRISVSLGKNGVKFTNKNARSQFLRIICDIVEEIRPIFVGLRCPYFDTVFPNFQIETEGKDPIELNDYFKPINFSKLFEKFGIIEGNQERIVKANKKKLEQLSKNWGSKNWKFCITQFLVYLFAELYDLRPGTAEKCYKTTVKSFSLAFDMAVVNKFLQPDLDKNVEIAEKVILNIKQSFEDMFYNSTWLSIYTQPEISLKIALMKYSLGQTTEKLGDYNMNPNDNLLKRFVHALQFETKVRNEYKIYPYFVDSILNSGASYLPNLNRMMVNVPFLIEPLFHHSYPEYLLYSVSGSTFGHEMGHSLRGNADGFDENGNPRNTYLLRKSELAKRELLEQCFIDQFSSAKFDNFETPSNYGEEILDENIADFLGKLTAFRAYRTAVSKRKEKIIVQGLSNFTEDQLFFYHAAQRYCVTPVAEYTFYDKEKQHWREVHPYDKHRVREMFSNFEEFEEAFKCTKKPNKCTMY